MSFICFGTNAKWSKWHFKITRVYIYTIKISTGILNKNFTISCQVQMLSNSLSSLKGLSLFSQAQCDPHKTIHYVMIINETSITTKTLLKSICFFQHGTMHASLFPVYIVIDGIWSYSLVKLASKIISSFLIT